MSTITLTLTVAPGTARRLAADDEARRRLEAMADAVFNEPEAYRLTSEQEAMIDEALMGVEAGQVRPFDPESSRARMQTLLQERVASQAEAA